MTEHNRHNSIGGPFWRARRIGGDKEIFYAVCVCARMYVDSLAPREARTAGQRDTRQLFVGERKTLPMSNSYSLEPSSSQRHHRRRHSRFGLSLSHWAQYYIPKIPPQKQAESYAAILATTTSTTTVSALVGALSFAATCAIGCTLQTSLYNTIVSIDVLPPMLSLTLGLGTLIVASHVASRTAAATTTLLYTGKNAPWSMQRSIRQSPPLLLLPRRRRPHAFKNTRHFMDSPTRRRDFADRRRRRFDFGLDFAQLPPHQHDVWKLYVYNMIGTPCPVLCAPRVAPRHFLMCVCRTNNVLPTHTHTHSYCVKLHSRCTLCSVFDFAVAA
jgi:hypothetical protein